jgi:hypothetical protein
MRLEFFNRDVIDNYLDANKINAELNDKKADWIWFSQWIFFIGIIIIPISTLVVFFNLPSHKLFNKPPIADAGIDKIVQENSLVELDASGSKDEDGRLKSYFWYEVCGVPVSLDNDSSPFPRFKAPNITGNNNETLNFRLIITDDNNSATADTVTVTVRNNETSQAYNRSLYKNGETIIPTYAYQWYVSKHYIYKTDAMPTSNRSLSTRCPLPSTLGTGQVKYSFPQSFPFLTKADCYYCSDSQKNNEIEYFPNGDTKHAFRTVFSAKANLEKHIIHHF